MKIDFIPFQIGMQYENWEFDLEPIELDIKLSYDKYVYFKKDIIQLYGVEVQYIYLYFNLDVLFKVEVIFKCRSPVQDFIYLATQLEKLYGKQSLCSSEDLLKLYKSWKDLKKHLIVKHHFRVNQVHLVLIDKNHVSL